MKELPIGVLDDIVRRLVDAIQPLEIYLFGSRARGDAHDQSDVDLLVVVADDAGDRHELAARAYLAIYGLRIPVDVVVQHVHEVSRWAPVKFSLSYEATRKGRRIYAAGVGVGT
jgi:predicted nucleotidyltransferase